jgi:hypothetical protein
MPDLVSRTQAGIAIVGQVDEAALGAEAAARANAHPGPDAGSAVGVQNFARRMGVDGQIGFPEFFVQDFAGIYHAIILMISNRNAMHAAGVL